MRASKEAIAMARQRLGFIEEKVSKSDLADNRNVAKAFEEIREVLNRAECKLPTEAAFRKDAQRRRARV